MPGALQLQALKLNSGYQWLHDGDLLHPACCSLRQVSKMHCM